MPQKTQIRRQVRTITEIKVGQDHLDEFARMLPGEVKDQIDGGSEFPWSMTLKFETRSNDDCWKFLDSGEPTYHSKMKGY